MNFKPPVEIAKTACVVAKAKANMSIKAMLVMGFLAGAYIAFGGFLMTTVTQDVAQYAGVGISKMLGGAVFALGLMLVIVGGAELFTGNCLMPIGMLSGCASFQSVLKNWTVVYIANFLGSIALAWMIYNTGLATGATGVNALKIAVAKVNLPMSQMIFRGILCNWLVVMAVWMSFSAMDVISKYICCLIPIGGFVTMGFEHSIANMYFIALGLFIKGGDAATVELAAVAPDKLAALTMGGYWGNLIPVTIGNMIGGILFVAVLYYMVFSGALEEPKA
ncbi:MAG: formate/nitrite transporter family protein [Synergistaceae bacterium]|nr:formate/nitrite transporter family protein [Synergistaceae bacterium]